MNSKLKKIILLIGDVSALLGALALTIYLRYPIAQFVDKFGLHLTRFVFIFLVFITILYINQLYNLNIRTWSQKFLLATINTAISAGLISVIYFYLSISSDVSPRTNLAIFVGLFLAAFFIWRLIFQALNQAMSKTGLAIIGDNQKSKIIQEELGKNVGAGYQLELIVKNEELFSELARQVENGKIKTIVLCDDFSSPKTGPLLLSLLSRQVSVVSYPDFYELLTHKIPVEAIGTNWFLENLQEGSHGYFHTIKRALDIIISAFILIISLPLWPFIALLIKLESKGPVFFKQARLGYQGYSFSIIKFRTMKTENNNQTLTVTGDRRITAFGNFLRKTRLDEIPQAINIFKGEMSFIGPRPERPELAKELEENIPFYNTRLIVKPGMSGWDQVSGEYHSPTKEDTLKKLQNDLFYIKNRSLFLDLVIALKTIATVFGRGGR